MIKKSTRIILIAFCLTTISLFLADGKVFAQTRQQLQQIKILVQNTTGDKFPFETKTPDGVRVYGISKPSSQMLAAIDRGLNDLFVIARKNNFKKRTSFSDYTVFIARADRTKDAEGKYSPDFAVGAAQYAGTIYDKGGYVYAAGMVVALNPSAFIIAEHAKQFERVADVVRYEGEHIVLYHNDRRRFEQTRTHDANNSHPILQ